MAATPAARTTAPAAGDGMRFVEDFALLLTDTGVPRMPARVFACVLADDFGGLTAAELADRLQVSPAAISGAVRWLMQMHLLTRAREPGARRDHYRMRDDQWYEATVFKTAALQRFEDVLAEGVEALRVERARLALESGTAPIDAVARRCGFGTVETLRRAFARRLGVSPAAYRNRFAA